MPTDKTTDKTNNEGFGDPTVKDQTARWERIAERAAQKAKYFSETVAPKVMNRPLNTRPIPKPDQLKDYIALLDNPQAVAERYQSLTQMMAPEKALETFIEWAEDMQKYYDLVNKVKD